MKAKFVLLLWFVCAVFLFGQTSATETIGIVSDEVSKASEQQTSSIEQRQKEYEEFIHVNVYNPKDERFIALVKHELAKEIVRFQHLVKSYPDIPVTVHIAPDKKTYEQWIENRHIVFENSLAFVDLQTNNIYIKHPFKLKYNHTLIRALLHEYIHLFVHHYWKDAPLWFHEGIAIYFSEGISLNFMYQFFASNSLHRNYLLLKYAYSYPDNRANLEPYFFQSALIINWMVDNDKDKLLYLFEFGNIYRQFPDCFKVAFGITQEDYLTNFASVMSELYKLNIYKGIIILTWISFPIFLIIAKIKKNHKAKQILAQWEIEESEMELELLQENSIEQPRNEDIEEETINEKG